MMVGWVVVEGRKHGSPRKPGDTDSSWLKKVEGGGGGGGGALERGGEQESTMEGVTALSFKLKLVYLLQP